MTEPVHIGSVDFKAGPFTGYVAAEWNLPELCTLLANIPAWIALAASTQLSAGSDPVYRVSAMLRGRQADFALKRFHPSGSLESAWYKRAGSRAMRSWRIAVDLMTRGVPTPEPVAVLEHWDGGRLAESYFLTVYEADLTSFRNELIRLYREAPRAEPVLDLMQRVADAIRAMHDAGVVHGDLGNQNILLRCDGATWSDIRFIDLNRARAEKGPLPLARRAFDLSRIHLPSDLLRIFFEMYFAGRPTDEFTALQNRYRGLYALRSRTRKLRHPIRSRQREKAAEPSITYPADRDLWLWDEKSGQAISTLRRVDRKKLYPFRNHLDIARGALRLALSARRFFHEFLEGAFQNPVDMTHRVGISVEPRASTWSREFELLKGLGEGLPVLVRFYRHEGVGQWTFAADAVKQLRKAGYHPSIALVQDRRAVVEPALWDAFATRVVESVAHDVEWVEVGHAINRMKWGIWSFDEYVRMTAVIPALRARFPAIAFMGPAGIDFEYFALLGVLPKLKERDTFDALSHHLYVDRRGAPENRQGGFATVEKLALARAIGKASGVCGERLIVSEVNWPLRDTGIHSPVCSPYLYPGQVFTGPGVTEEEYADYMIRYLLLALCSGLADRVYWWRLVARGYGLVDDTNPDAWRPRPAYEDLRYFLGDVGTARFIRRESDPEGGFAYHFARADGRSVTIRTKASS